MTAVNVHLAEDAVHLITDGLAYDLTNLSSFGRMSKVQHLPWLNAAYAVSGYVSATMITLANFADMQVDTFDDLAARLGDFIASSTQYQRASNFQHMDNCEIVVAGWSESRQKPEAYVVATFGDVSKPSFKPRPILEAYSRPYDASMVSKKFDPSRPAETGMAMLQTQRQMNTQTVGGVKGAGVGGFGQHTILRRDEIVTRCIGKWADTPGHTLDPRVQPVS